MVDRIVYTDVSLVIKYAPGPAYMDLGNVRKVALGSWLHNRRYRPSSIGVRRAKRELQMQFEQGQLIALFLYT